MKVRLFKEPELEKPVLICGWPGIGNIGLITVDTLRIRVSAEEFGEIESWDFFYPRKIKIEEGLLVDLEFPSNKFYFKNLLENDLIFFIGEEQPRGDQKAYRISESVLDVAINFGCQRIFTSGAAVAPIHHQMKPRVWAVPNKGYLIDEVRRYENTVLMSDIEGRGDQGYITGLNGLLIGMAKERGLEAICLMGEIPLYIPHSLPYPKASKSVLEVLTKILGIKIDLSRLEKWAQETEKRIEEFYQQIPTEMKERIERLIKTEEKPFTEEDRKRFVKEVEEFLKRSKEDGEVPL
ncbi:MAG: PAC2 family protein [Nitrospirae bacterium]|nr:PAC2 family protein [Nitrospirota bacterium]